MTNDTEHIVTSLEPCWVKDEHAPNDDGNPEPISGRLETQDIIESHYDESEYECSCGAELDSWDDVQTHFQEVTE